MPQKKHSKNSRSSKKSLEKRTADLVNQKISSFKYEPLMVTTITRCSARVVSQNLLLANTKSVADCSQKGSSTTVHSIKKTRVGKNGSRMVRVAKHQYLRFTHLVRFARSVCFAYP